MTSDGSKPLTYTKLEGEMTLGEILGMEMEEQRPLPLLTRRDVFIAGASHLIAGKPKAGKSTLLRYQAYTWALDGHSILYLSEDSPLVWQKRLVDLGFEDVAGLTIVPGFRYDPNRLLHRARTGPEEIVILDTILGLLDLPSLTRSDIVTPVIKDWVGEITGRGKTLILSGHMVKRTRGAEVGEAIGGAQAFQALVDTLIELHIADTQDDDSLRVVNVRSRLFEHPTTFAIRKAGASFEVIERPGEVILSDAQRDVLSVLDTQEARTIKEVMTATGFTEAKARRLLRDLAARRLARDVSGHAGAGHGGRGLQAAYVAVLDDDQEEVA